MKFPKNRANVFSVVRRFDGDFAVCGVFANFEEADDYKTAIEQEWKEKTKLDDATFLVMLSTFYG